METGNIIGLFGAAVVVIFGLLPFAPFRVSPRVVYGGLIFGFALLGICAVEMWQKISPGLSVTANGATIATISAWPSALAFGAIFASIMWVSLDYCKYQVLKNGNRGSRKGFRGLTRRHMIF
jgi:hypothetical protein